MAYERDIAPHGPVARARAIQQLGDAKIVARLCTRLGDSVEYPSRMWRKVNPEEKVWPVFERGWGRFNSRYDRGPTPVAEHYYLEGWVFVPIGCFKDPPVDAIAAASAAPREKRKRRKSVDPTEEAALRNRIQSVLAAAKRRRRKGNYNLSDRDVSAALFRSQEGQEFSEETIRQIIRGTYRPMKRLGIKCFDH